MKNPRFIYAANRKIGVKILEFILAEKAKPLALLLPEGKVASYDYEMEDLCQFLDQDQILYGLEFKKKEGLDLLRSLSLDYIICIHFPHLIPKEVLDIPKYGVLNLHPGYLPFARGWHTPTWAILEDVPYGATLHFMDIEVDSGDIVNQKKIEILESDTANSLYKRVLDLEVEVFKEAWPSLVEGTYNRIPQNPLSGTIHQRKDLFSPEIQCIDLKEKIEVQELLRKLRALSTNRIEEAAYFEIDGKRFHVQVNIVEEEIDS